MKKTRKEIVSHREHPVTLFYALESETDPITGEPIGGGHGEIYTNAVVTEFSSMASSSLERYLQNGILIEKGDIWFSVFLEDIGNQYDNLTWVRYDGRDYEVLAKDKKGIGERNRVEFVGRLRS
ncbi:hypothetical protein MHI57_24575 [Cytobacillus sp. FSL K6-0129]|uniref:hypothetical protein n=1 Tax=Cytobacillus sp. FSL K6-0129 TaxID=2921421 RepID=UPI0030F72EF0